MPKSALSIVKEYKETPFEFYRLVNKQITIIEDLPRSKNIRERIEHNDKYNKNITYYYIKVQEGLFEKDLKLTENQLTQLFLVLPQDMLNFKGATLTVIQDGLNREFSYVGHAEGMNENFHPKSSDIAKSMEPATSQQSKPMSDMGSQLAHAIELNFKMGIKTDRETLSKMADAINPGKGLDLIVSAKTEGWIYEKDGIFRGE